MTIPLVNLKRQHQALGAELRNAIESVIDRGDFILGRETAAFEEEFAEYCGAEHCIGVGNGLDALTLALKAYGIGPGDEVITVTNTFVATAVAIQHTGATPVLIDHDAETFNLDPKLLPAALSSRTRAIVPVHLYGQCADMDAINEFARAHDLYVIEDACQAHGAMYKGHRAGSLGHAAAFSFYPGKNLGGLGDGGAVVTSDPAVADHLRSVRNYGSTVKYHHAVRGYNSRLDSLQAAVLRIKLRHLNEWNARRRQLADIYRDELCDAALMLPSAIGHDDHVYHLFVVRVINRDSVVSRLKEQGIECGIHYPTPVHQQPALGEDFRLPHCPVHTELFCQEILSLPICPFTEECEVQAVARELVSALDASDVRADEPVLY